MNYSAELAWAQRIRRQQPGMRLGFIGGMSAANPQLYLDQGDFVIAGETESALMQGEIGNFSGLVTGEPLPDLDALPFPDWSHLPVPQAGYGLLRRAGAFLTHAFQPRLPYVLRLLLHLPSGARRSFPLSLSAKRGCRDCPFAAGLRHDHGYVP